MALTEEQQLEMYSNINVIASNCVTCKKSIDDHEKRIRFLEKYYWIFFGISISVIFILRLILKASRIFYENIRQRHKFHKKF